MILLQTIQTISNYKLTLAFHQKIGCGEDPYEYQQTFHRSSDLSS